MQASSHLTSSGGTYSPVFREKAEESHKTLTASAIVIAAMIATLIEPTFFEGFALSQSAVLYYGAIGAAILLTVHTIIRIETTRHSQLARCTALGLALMGAFALTYLPTAMSLTHLSEMAVTVISVTAMALGWVIIFNKTKREPTFVALPPQRAWAKLVSFLPPYREVSSDDEKRLSPSSTSKTTPHSPIEQNLVKLRQIQSEFSPQKPAKANQIKKICNNIQLDIDFLNIENPNRENKIWRDTYTWKYIACLIDILSDADLLFSKSNKKAGVDVLKDALLTILSRPYAQQQEVKWMIVSSSPDYTNLQSSIRAQQSLGLRIILSPRESALLTRRVNWFENVFQQAKQPKPFREILHHVAAQWQQLLPSTESPPPPSTPSPGKKRPLARS